MGNVAQERGAQTVAGRFVARVAFGLASLGSILETCAFFSRPEKIVPRPSPVFAAARSCRKTALCRQGRSQGCGQGQRQHGSTDSGGQSPSGRIHIGCACARGCQNRDACSRNQKARCFSRRGNAPGRAQDRTVCQSESRSKSCRAAIVFSRSTVAVAITQACAQTCGGGSRGSRGSASGKQRGSEGCPRRSLRRAPGFGQGGTCIESKGRPETGCKTSAGCGPCNRDTRFFTSNASHKQHRNQADTCQTGGRSVKRSRTNGANG